MDRYRCYRGRAHLRPSCWCCGRACRRSRETQQDVGAKQTELTGVIVDLAARVKTLEDESGRMKTWIQAAVPWMRRAHRRLLELDPTWSDGPPDEPKL